MKNLLLTIALLLGYVVHAQQYVNDVVEKKFRTGDSLVKRVGKEPIGVVNWTGQFIEAGGESFYNRERFKIPGQAEAMAREGAKAVALANLLEIAGDVKVTKTTTVSDMITENVSIRTEVEGLIRGAQMVSETKGDYSVQVVMRLYLYGSGGLSEPFRPAKTPKVGDFDSLSIRPNEKHDVGNDGSDVSDSAQTDPLKQTVQDLVSASQMNNNSPVSLLNLKNKDSLKNMLTLIPQNIFNENGDLIINMEELFRKTGQSPKILKYSDKMLKMLRDAGLKTEKIDAYYKDGRIVVNENQIKSSGKFWEWVKKQKPGSESLLWKMLPMVVGLL